MSIIKNEDIHERCKEKEDYCAFLQRINQILSSSVSNTIASEMKHAHYLEKKT
jgi:hypothetical protein